MKFNREKLPLLLILIFVLLLQSRQVYPQTFIITRWDWIAADLPSSWHVFATSHASSGCEEKENLDKLPTETTPATQWVVCGNENMALLGDESDLKNITPFDFEDMRTLPLQNRRIKTSGEVKAQGFFKTIKWALSSRTINGKSYVFLSFAFGYHETGMNLTLTGVPNTFGSDSSLFEKIARSIRLKNPKNKNRL